MKILSAEQIRLLDKYTIVSEPVSSINLMERAAVAVINALEEGLINKSDVIHIFCGMGNNGGDGLAIARLLIQAGYLHVTAYVVRHSPNASADFGENEQRLKNFAGIRYIETAQQIPPVSSQSVVIDALFGSGLTRAVDGVSAAVIEAVNVSGASVYSVDIPSGMYCDKPNNPGDAVINADVVFTFHAPKLSFLLPASGTYIKSYRVLNIGLNADYAASLPSPYYYITAAEVAAQFRQRDKFTHKGTYGHALIAAGSYGKIGAAVLCVRAALRSGAGLISALVPRCGYQIMQVSNPPAMVLTGTDATSEEIICGTHWDFEQFDTLAVGPGLNTHAPTVEFLEWLLKTSKKPLVLDADALNIIAEHKYLQALLPANSILTPHPGEFKRLAGEWTDDLDKLQKQMAFAEQHNAIVVLKGAHTTVATPRCEVHFNSTGNPGMAKGGSGDVLTGVIVALLAQRYSATAAAILGVYVHGLAGDYASRDLGQTAMHAGDIVNYLPEAFRKVEAYLV